MLQCTFSMGTNGLFWIRNIVKIYYRYIIPTSKQELNLFRLPWSHDLSATKLSFAKKK